MYKFTIVLLSLIWFTPTIAAETISAEKKTDIKKLLSVTNALGFGKIMAQGMTKHLTEALKKARPDIPEKMFDVLAEEVNNTIDEAMVEKDGLIDLVIPVYDKHFSHDEIKGLISFYETPLGRKAISTMPTMTQESIVIGQRWGQSLGPIIEKRVKARFKKKGIEL